MPDIALWPACDHRCTMCSNFAEYKFTTSFYSFENIKKRIDQYKRWDDRAFHRFPENKEDWTITWWEPTLNPDYFKILAYIRKQFPNSRIVQLTHWDRFADEKFTKKISLIPNYHIVIPIHWYNKKTHEDIVRKKWAWELVNKWIKNILKYKRYQNQTLEIRIVIQWQNYKFLDKIYEYILINYPEVDSVVSIMMEYEWQAIDNIYLTRVTYTDVFKINTDVFLKYGELFWEEKFKLYHFPLCTVKEKKLWKYLWRTLPAHEIVFLWKCITCKLAKYCMGIHEAYCEYNGEEEIMPFLKKDIKNIKIVENKYNFKYKPIKDVLVNDN